jgi:uncharacterized protein YjbI with pentapeptide repeats
MAGEPRPPYPPDVDEDAPAANALDDAVDAKLDGLDLANTRAIRSSLRRVELRLCRLTGAELAEATWTDVVLEDCRLDLAGLRASKLERVVFRDCRMEECDLAGSRLKDVRFERCTLRQAVLAGCTVERVEVAGCDLAGLAGVESLRGARMPWGDALENAPLFAAALGIELLDES